MDIVMLENVSKKYNNKVVFSGLNLSIAKGQLIALTGKSGIGKSTLLNIMGLILDNTDGNVSIYGHKNLKINSKEAMMIRRNKIGYLFQNFGLIDDESVFYNLNLALAYKNMKRKDKINRIDELLEEFRLIELKKKKVYQLSGGEQQRVAIIRLILQDCDLILADEPTGSLDEINRNLIMKLLKDLNASGKTIIIVTHDPYIASQCKNVIEISNLIIK